MRKLVLAAAAFAVSSPTGLYALGLGEIKLHSALNQPLSAEIALLSVRKQDLPSLRVALAPEEAFGRAGIDRPHYLNQLKFELVPSDAGATVKVTSRDPIREPFLNFIIEADWANGSLLREYTLLLDPPELMRAAPAVVEAPVAATPAPMAAAGDDENLPPPGSKVTSFGPTRANYTLWRIALRLRPDESITVQQMMLALLRANPEAFNGDNVNGLKAGYVLRVPGAEEARRLSAAEAIAEVKRQHAEWKRFVAGGGLESEAAPIQRGGGSPPVQPAKSAGELKLTSTKRAAEPVPGAGGVAEEAPAEVLRDELAVATEAVASRERENEELLVRINELENQIGDLNSLVTMKNEQLALLQKRLHDSGSEAPTPSEPPVEAALPSEAAPPAEEAAPGAEVEETPAAEMPMSAEGAAEGEAPAAAPGDDVVLVADAAADLPSRVEAATRLGESGDAGAVAPLAAVLAGDEQWTMRRAAAEALGKLGGEAAVDALLPALAGDEQPMVRREAALALGRIKSPRTIEPLESALADEATVEVEVDGKLEPRMVVSEAAEEALIAIDMAAQQVKTEVVAPAPEAAEPAPAVAEEKPAPVVPAPAPAPAPEPAGFVIPFLEIAVPLELGAIFGDPILLGGVGGVVALLLVGLLLVARRRRAAAEAAGVPDEVAAASVAAALAVEEEPESVKAAGDPIAEADVYLDIGQYQKAEDLLKAAIAAEPSRHDLKTKLLEIYFAAKSVEPFEALAGQLHKDLGGGGSPVWNRVREMGVQLAPNYPLFAAAGAAAVAGAVAAEEPEVELELPDSLDLDIDLGGGEATAEEGGLDVDLALPEGIDEAESAAVEAAVDFDLTLPGGTTLDAVTAEEPITHDEGHVLDFDLTDFGGDSAGSVTSEIPEEPADTGNLVDFDLTLPGGDLVGGEGEEGAIVHDEGHVLDFDLGLDDGVSEGADVEVHGEEVVGDVDLDLTPPGSEGAPEGSEDEGTISLDLNAGSERGELSEEEPVSLGLGGEEPSEEAPASLDLGVGELSEEEPVSLDLDGEELSEEESMSLDLGGEELSEEEPVSLDLDGKELSEEEPVSLDLGGEELSEEEPVSLDLGGEGLSEGGPVSLDLGGEGLIDEEPVSLDLGGEELSEEEPVSLDLGGEGLIDEEPVSLDLGGEELTEEEPASLDLGGGELSEEEPVSLDLGGEGLTEEEPVSLDLGGGELSEEEPVSLELGEEEPSEEGVPSLDLGEGWDTEEEMEVSATDLDLGEDGGVALDLGVEESELDADAFSLDLGDLGGDEAFDLTSAEEEGAPLDLGALDDAGADDSLPVDLGGPAGDSMEESELDLGLDLDLGLGIEEEDADEGGMVLDLGEHLDEAAMEDGGDQTLILDAPVEEAADETLRIGGVPGLDLTDDEALGMEEDGGLPSDVDEVANKLDLARAFIGMGDEEGAKALLDEVMAEGSEEQKRQAQEML